jgi:uncharacterized delta-60 repeat protein
MKFWNWMFAASALAGADAFAQSIDTFNPLPNGPPTTVALQADGKILIAGSFLQVGTTARTRMARLNTNGSLDTSFADPLVNGEIKAVAVQPDGKILIGGDFDAVSTNTRHYLARLNADGSTDTTFADPNLNATVWAIALQPNQTVLVAGDFTFGSAATSQTYIARFTASGVFDSSFAPPNICCLPARSIAVQSNGNILVGGFFSHVNNTTHFNFAQFSSTGSFNSAFPGGSVQPEAGSIVVAPDGTIYINDIGASTKIKKYSATGAPIAVSKQQPAIDGEIESFVLQPDGKLLISGTFENAAGVGHHGVARLNADTSLDASFADLHFSTSASDANGYVYGLAAEANGNVIAIGNFILANGQSRQYMARVIGNDPGSSSFTGAASGSNTLITWTRTGGGAEFGAAPVLQHSSDGVNYTDVGPMTRVTNGWQISAPYNLAGPPFYLRAQSFASTGAGNGSIGHVTSAVFSDRIFADGFEP